MSTYLFGGGPLLHYASVIYSHEQNPNSDAIALSQSLWDALKEDAGVAGDELSQQQRHVLAVSVRVSDRQRKQKFQTTADDDKPSNSSNLVALTVWATIDTNVPASSNLITIPESFQSKYPSIFLPAPDSTFTTTTAGDGSISTDSQSFFSHTVALTRPPTLTELFVVALSNSAYGLLESAPTQVEDWFCDDAAHGVVVAAEDGGTQRITTKMIVRQGETYAFTKRASNGIQNGTEENGAQGGGGGPAAAGPHAGVATFAYRYRVLMAEPVLQGVAERGKTTFIVVPPQEDEAEQEPGEEDARQDVTVNGSAGEDGRTEDGEEDAYDDDESNLELEIDENFLASTMFSSSKPAGSATRGKADGGVGHERSPSGGGAASKRDPLAFSLRSLEEPAFDGGANVEYEEATLVLRTRDLGKVGAFSGDWVIVGVQGSERQQTRLARVVCNDSVGLASTAIASPTLTSNILFSTVPSTNPTITIHPAPFSSSHSPPIPTATTATIARIASPHASDKTFQPLFLRALKRYFQGRVRVVKEGDIVAVPIWVEQADLLKSGKDRGAGKDGVEEGGGERKDGKEDGEEINEDVLDYDFALSSTRPSNVVFFKITNLEYDILDTSISGRELDSYAAATMGELGCLIDPTITKMVQTGLEHARIPNVRSFFDIRTGFCALPTSSRLTAAGSPFAKLYDIVQAVLAPSAVDYGLPISVLLKGSRGIGKQTVARWVAEDLGVHVYEINCFDVVGETEVKTEGILRARFERATGCAPCIFLLRHIEALAKTTQTLETGREPAIIPALRECIDELRQGWRVSGFPTILVATTSDPEHVPVGILGCFKHEIAFEVPNEPERLDVLGTLLEGLPLSLDVSVQSVATQTAALVAADLVDLVERANLASMERVLKATPATELRQADLTAAGIQLTATDFDVALSKARASYSESIGAPKIPNVSWDDVGGLANVKQDILDTIQLPLEHPELFADGLKKRSGILLYGPPGTGKTLLAKAVATSCSLNFFSVKGPELLNMYIGESEANVRRVFQRARDAKPCVIFFDELDSVAPKRGNTGDSGGVMDRIVSQLLAELDGMSDGKGGADVFVIGATNRPDLLDPALLRPGRFDRMLYLGVSDTHDAQLKIIQALTRKFRLDPALELRTIASQCPFNYTGADFYALCSDAMLKAMSRKAQEVDTKIATLNAQPPPYKHPHPITPQYYLAEIATDAETDVVVAEVDFKAALEELVPSVSGSEMEHYRQVQQKFAKDTINSKKSDEADEEPPASSKGKGKAKAVD